jgi:hypothetical protein
VYRKTIQQHSPTEIHSLHKVYDCLQCKFQIIFLFLIDDWCLKRFVIFTHDTDTQSIDYYSSIIVHTIHNDSRHVFGPFQLLTEGLQCMLLKTEILDY